MSQIQTAPTGLPRRRVLASAFAATVIPPVTASTLPRTNDATVLALCAEFWRVHDQARSPVYSIAHPFGSQEQRQTEIELDRLCQLENGLIRQLAETPANTPDGVRAKASLLQRFLPEFLEYGALDDESVEMELVMGLLADIARGAA
ncbi:hypothetical protein [Acetobacter sp.]|uniref:hypothetical protein n=1 Tax=Acetobacter sp. TaxID=440 RepID=UPI0039EA30BC